jgi:hypothetical protein
MLCSTPQATITLTVVSSLSRRPFFKEGNALKNSKNPLHCIASSDEVHSDNQVEQHEEWLDYQNVVAQLPGYTLEEFINLDNDLCVCAEPKVVSAENQVDGGDEDVPMVSDNESEGSESEEIQKPSKTEIGSALSILERFSATTEVSEHFVECLNHIGEECAAKMRPMLVIKDINFFFILDDSYASTAYSENIAVYIQSVPIL